MFLRWVSWTSSSVSLNSLKTLEEILSSDFRIIHDVLVDRRATDWAGWWGRIGWVKAQHSSTAGRATPIPALARLIYLMLVRRIKLIGRTVGGGRRKLVCFLVFVVGSVLSANHSSFLDCFPCETCARERGEGGGEKLLGVPSVQCYGFLNYCALPVDVPGWGGSLFCANVAVQVVGSIGRAGQRDCTTKISCATAAERGRSVASVYYPVRHRLVWLWRWHDGQGIDKSRRDGWPERVIQSNVAPRGKEFLTRRLLHHHNHCHAFIS